MRIADSGQRLEIVKKLTLSQRKHTWCCRIDHKKADTFQKKYYCVGNPNRYNRNRIGVLSLTYLKTALKQANGPPVEK